MRTQDPRAHSSPPPRPTPSGLQNVTNSSCICKAVGGDGKVPGELRAPGLWPRLCHFLTTSQWARHFSSQGSVSPTINDETRITDLQCLGFWLRSSGLSYLISKVRKLKLREVKLSLAGHKTSTGSRGMASGPWQPNVHFGYILIPGSSFQNVFLC